MAPSGQAACGVRVVCVATVGSDWCTRVYVFVSPRQYSSGLDRSRVLRRKLYVHCVPVLIRRCRRTKPGGCRLGGDGAGLGVSPQVEIESKR